MVGRGPMYSAVSERCSQWRGPHGSNLLIDSFQCIECILSHVASRGLTPKKQVFFHSRIHQPVHDRAKRWSWVERSSTCVGRCFRVAEPLGARRSSWSVVIRFPWEMCAEQREPLPATNASYLASERFAADGKDVS